MNDVPWSVNELGRGGFGIIYLCIEKETRRKIVVKACHNASQRSEKSKERWKSECEIMTILDHPHIIKTVVPPTNLHFFDNDPNPILMLEFCNKEDLRKEICRPYNIFGLEEYQVKMIAHDVSSALEYLHDKKIYHRDLKPENIILNQNPGERIVYKVIDLGYAKVVTKDSICNSFVGTLQYLAPELMTSNEPKYTRTVDFWSLGTTIFECITGFRPFLPNSELIRWLEVVREKKDYHIYACPNNAGQHVLYEKLPTPNRLCELTQMGFEQWLQLMLRYNPGKRGGMDHSSYPQCFPVLGKILNQKILHVYSPMTNSMDCFDVDNESLRTVQQLKTYYRFKFIKSPLSSSSSSAQQSPTSPPTSPPPESFFFVTPSGIIPDSECLLENYCSRMNYDFVTDSAQIKIDLFMINLNVTKDVAPRPLGRKLEHILKSKDDKYEFGEQQKIAKQLCYYTMELRKDMCNLVEAAEAVCLCVVRERTDTDKIVNDLRDDIVKLESNMEFFNRCIGKDLDELRKQLGNSVEKENMKNAWEKDQLKLKNFNMSSDEIVSSMSCVECKLSQTLKSTCSDYSLVKSKMASYFNTAYDIYENLKNQPHNLKQSTNRMPELLSCLKNCRETRDLMSKDYIHFIRNLVSWEKEFKLIRTKATHSITILNQMIDNIYNMQTRRQESIWQLVSNNSTNKMTRKSSQSANQNTPLSPITDSSSNIEGNVLCARSKELIERVQSMLASDKRAPYNSVVDTLDWNFLKISSDD